MYILTPGRSDEIASTLAIRLEQKGLREGQDFRIASRADEGPTLINEKNGQKKQGFKGCTRMIRSIKKVSQHSVETR